MSKLRPNREWLRLWEQRGQAIRKVLGETTPPGEVIPFSWRDYILPGACALAFGPGGTRAGCLYMTLGLTQPVEPAPPACTWEFCVRTRDWAAWAHQLLYDLLTYYLSEQGQVDRGLYLPLTFFTNPSGDLCVGLTDDTSALNVVGDMRGVYIWDDLEQLQFEVSSGNFGLMTAITVTGQEDRLAREATPPHLILLLEEMGIGQLSDPLRRSVMELPGAQNKWETIRELSHDQVIRKLNNRT